jgi:hypothetical protein
MGLLDSIVPLRGCTCTTMQKLALDEQAGFQKPFYKPLCPLLQ